MFQYGIDCGAIAALPDLEIELNGVKITMTNIQYTVHFVIHGQDICYSGVLG